MARNTPLANIVAMLKVELGYNATPGTAVGDDLPLAALIAEKQRWLADTYDWPFMEHRWDVAVGNSARYVPFPTLNDQGNTIAINFERPVKLETFWSANWDEVIYGIGSEEFNYRDSDQVPPDLLDPVQRWRFNDETQFEIWPMPASAQKLRFTGQRVPNPLLSFQPSPNGPACITALWANTVDLDDQMVMLFAAAEKLQLMEKANAQSVLQRANARMTYIRQSYPRREMNCSFQGGKRQQYNKIIPVKRILVA